jgi:hypothetical protein
MLITLYRIPAEARSRAPITAEQLTLKQLLRRGLQVKTLRLALAGDPEAPCRGEAQLAQAVSKLRDEEYRQFLRLCHDVEAALELKLTRSAKPRAFKTAQAGHDASKCEVVRSAYAWATPQDKYRSRFLPMRWPDLVRDDLAYRKYNRHS